MNFLADESVDQPIIARLRHDGHEILAVAEMSPSISDETVLSRARDRCDVLITADKDFGEIVFRQKRMTTGVVLIRLAGLSSEAKAALVSNTVHNHGPAFRGAFSVLTPGGIRIRPGF